MVALTPYFIHGLSSAARAAQVTAVTKLTPLHMSAFDLSTIETAVNAWSVNGPDLNSADLAANLFASSLFPYLALLFFLAR
jgi:hypothetical protein